MVDLTNLAPQISVRFLENEEIMMPELSAYLLHAYAEIDEPEALSVTDIQFEIDVEFRMYIETWGTGGWQLNLTLDYQAGTPLYKYSGVEELWHGDYSFGDPADLS